MSSRQFVVKTQQCGHFDKKEKKTGSWPIKSSFFSKYKAIKQKKRVVVHMHHEIISKDIGTEAPAGAVAGPPSSN